MAPRPPTEPPRGMRDFLPAEAELRDAASATILTVYRATASTHRDARHGGVTAFCCRHRGRRQREARSSTCSSAARGCDPRAAATEADLTDLGLRYDLTVPLARFYANNRGELPKPFRAIQIGPVWRAERPAEGPLPPVRAVRHRHHRRRLARSPRPSSSSRPPRPSMRSGSTASRCGINDRRLLTGMPATFGFAAERHGSVLITIDKLDKIGPDGVAAELRAVGPSRRGRRAAHGSLAKTARSHGPGRRARRAAAARRRPARSSPCGASSTTVERGRGAAGSGIAFDPFLVRGMGYYTGPSSSSRSSSFAVARIAGGGRYDGMIGKLPRAGRPGHGILDRLRAHRRTS